MFSWHKFQHAHFLLRETEKDLHIYDKYLSEHVEPVKECLPSYSPKGWASPFPSFNKDHSTILPLGISTHFKPKIITLSHHHRLKAKLLVSIPLVYSSLANEFCPSSCLSSLFHLISPLKSRDSLPPPSHLCKNCGSGWYVSFQFPQPLFRLSLCPKIKIQRNTVSQIPTISPSWRIYLKAWDFFFF